MFSILRGRLGVPGILAIVALVFAMVGGAWAAGGLTKSQEKQITKIAKKYAGKPGVQGPAGQQGSSGPGGAAGAKGDKGETGAPGGNGESVVTTLIAPGGTCTEGGTEFEVGGSSEVICNGETGPEGVCSTSNCVLPQDVTETGMYAVVQTAEFNPLFAPLSFNIKLSAALDSSHVVFVPPPPAANPDAVHCNGSSVNPKAASGYLCVYGTAQEHLLGTPAINDYSQVGHPTGAGVSGAVLGQVAFGGVAQMAGTWAVTG